MSRYDVSHPYFGVFLLFVITTLAFYFTLKLQRYVSRKISSLDREKLKLSPYECGPTPNIQKSSISTHYFLMALLFILFDIEVLFFYPWALDFKLFKDLGLSGFAVFEMSTFIGLLVVGFIYAWKKGALSWQSMK